jgi:tetratricopeptide (TPR) repeat protein
MSIAEKYRSKATAAFLVLAALFASAVTMSTPAAANDDRMACLVAHGDEKTDACTRAISTGGLQGHDLAAVYLNRGLAHLDRIELNDAIADFNAAIRLDPDFAAAYDARGVAFRFRPDRAILDFDDAIRLDPNSAKAYAHRGGAYLAKGDVDRAMADLNKAIELDPNNAEAYRTRGAAYRRKGDLDGAIAEYSEAIRLDPTDKYAYLTRGGAYQAKGDLDHAIADYDEAIRLGPFSHAYEVRGSAYRAKGDFDRAIADYDEAIRRNPRDATAFHGRGLARQAKGDAAGGTADLAEAKRLTTILGMPIPALTKLHVAISLIAIVSGLIVMVGMLTSRRLPGWTAVFLTTAIVTSVSGFFFHLASLSPLYPVGLISLVVLAIALLALVAGRLAGHWRWIYVIAASAAVYLNVYAGAMQALVKLPFLLRLLPRENETTYVAVNLAVLAVFVGLGIWALRRFHPPTALQHARP